MFATFVKAEPLVLHGQGMELSFPNNLGAKSLVRALLQGSSPWLRRGSFLEET